MAISKKYSRRIVVDGIVYRWRIPPVVEYNQTGHDGLFVVNVWHEAHTGQTLRLVGGRHPKTHPATPGVSMTPRQVANAIRAALKAGWSPAKRQRTFRFDLPPPSEK